MRSGPAAAACAALLLLALGPTSARAQRTHLLVVTGLGGAPEYSAAFLSQGAALMDVAARQWNVGDSSRIWLAEDAAHAGVTARATREAVAESFLRLSRQVRPGDVLVVALIGHGSGEGAQSRVNLPGVDPTAAEYAGWLAGFTRQTLVFVVGASGSGDFAVHVKGPGRVIVTATRTPFERNESRFSAAFVRGLASGDADADKDGRLTVLESYAFAVREVARRYQEERAMLTEHALVSDSTLAARTVYAAPAASADPRVAQLIAELRELEARLDRLKARKGGTPVAEYDRELEALLVAIAEKSAEVRAAGGRP